MGQEHFADHQLLDPKLQIILSSAVSSNAISIIAVLFNNLAIYLNELGIDSVKHLKYVLPMLTETLSHPLGISSVPMLLSAVSAMQDVIRNCWPRMVEYRGEVLKGLCFCWLNVIEKSEAGELRGKMKETVKMLGVAIKAEDFDLREDARVLVAADTQLEVSAQVPFVC